PVTMKPPEKPMYIPYRTPASPRNAGQITQKLSSQERPQFCASRHLRLPLFTLALTFRPLATRPATIATRSMSRRPTRKLDATHLTHHAISADCPPLRNRAGNRQHRT